ncbi:uncharacterized protein LOC102313455 [Haplochromis burtoni]|uniref:uncharacterized protein LOC102313455 n=1 Tax=Haplochromis burtoni TaxID=8153 RepID=UPI0006C9C47A|nr:uncharacterized protein LOC102313455 [Haplochromis burtoni]
MGRTLFLLTALLGVVFCSHGKLSGPELVLRVRPADNITLHCDCRKSSRNFIVWFRNCSHENQPSLILRTNYKYDPSYLEDKVDILNPFPRLHLLENQSSDSYDLLIMNTTDSDEGLYYCGTEQKEIDATFSQKYIYKYGNITTRILLTSTVTRHDIHKPQEDCGVCWKLLFTLCPFIVALFSLLSSVLFYQLRQKIENNTSQDDMKTTESQSHIKQDEDVCYAALEIRQASQRPNKKKIQSSDFSTYSSINTSQI